MKPRGKNINPLWRVNRALITIEKGKFKKEVFNNNGDVFTDLYEMFRFGANIIQNEIEWNISFEVERSFDNVDFYEICREVKEEDTKILLDCTEYAYSKTLKIGNKVYIDEAEIIKNRGANLFRSEIPKKGSPLTQQVKNIELYDIANAIGKRQYKPPLHPYDPERWTLLDIKNLEEIEKTLK